MILHDLIKNKTDASVQDVAEALKGTKNIDEPDEEGISPLLYAAMGGNAEIVALLLTHGANPFITDLQGENALTYAARYNHTKIVDLLQKLGVPSTLMAAALLGDITTLERLLSPGKDVVNRHDPTPLLWAAEKGHIDAVLALVRLGIALDTKDEFGSALAHAALNGHYQLVKVLIELGMDINSSSAFGPALMLASARDHPDIVSLLLAKGANVNATDKFGDTALTQAAMLGDGNIAEILLVHGADPFVANAWGENALYYAKGNNYEGIVKMIEESEKPTIST